MQDVSLELGRGEVLGLLGHNGAGKSTTLQMLAGVLRPDSGSIAIGGADLATQPERAKRQLGFLPETPPLYRDMTVDAYLIFAARLRQVTDVAGALAETRRRCGLESVSNKLIAHLSKGYQQRVGLAQAIIHAPLVVILDEPTVGLDPAQLREMRGLIRELGDAHSVILSSHMLAEVEAMCDRVAILHRGRLVHAGPTADADGLDLETRFLQATAETAP